MWTGYFNTFYSCSSHTVHLNKTSLLIILRFSFLTLLVWNEEDLQVGLCRVKIKFLPLLFMYNSAQEAVGHLKGTADTKKGWQKESRKGGKDRQGMEEVEKKRPIISARERGQWRRTQCVCECVCACFRCETLQTSA